jgi:hypothetical protein
LSGLADELADKHVADGTSLNDFCKVALREKEAMSKKANVTGAAPAAITSESKVNDQVVEAAICLSAKLPDPDKHYSEQTLDAANKHFRSGVTLGELLLMKARANGFTGYNVRRNLREVLQLAFSTNDISGITSNIANKFILEGWLSFRGYLYASFVEAGRLRLQDQHFVPPHRKPDLRTGSARWRNQARNARRRSVHQQGGHLRPHAGHHADGHHQR